MQYYIYQITNLINKKIYIGCHKTNNWDDGYMGSSKFLLNDIAIFGINSFKKEILYVFKSEKKMFEKEAELVNESFILRDDTYNICVGGHGGWYGRNEKRNWLWKNDEEWKNKYSKSLSNAQSKLKRSAESNEKRSITLKKHWKTNLHNRIGTIPWNKNQKGSQIAWNKNIKMPTIQCPHCHKIGSVSNMKRWHFNNCKINYDRNVSENDRHSGSQQILPV